MGLMMQIKVNPVLLQNIMPLHEKGNASLYPAGNKGEKLHHVIWGVHVSIWSFEVVNLKKLTVYVSTFSQKWGIHVFLNQLNHASC